MKKTMNQKMDKAIKTQMDYFRTLCHWVRKENETEPGTVIYKICHDTRTKIEDSKTYDGIPFKTLVRSVLDEIEETNEDEYDRIISIIGSIDELEMEMVREARAIVYA